MNDTTPLNLKELQRIAKNTELDSGFHNEPRPENKEALLRLEQEGSHDYETLRKRSDSWDNPAILTFIESFGGEVCMDEDNSMYTFLKTFLSENSSRRHEERTTSRMKDVIILEEYASILAEISHIVFEMCRYAEDYGLRKKKAIIANIKYHAITRVSLRHVDAFWKKGGFIETPEDPKLLAEIDLEVQTICRDLMPYLIYKLNSYVAHGEADKTGMRFHRRRIAGTTLANIFAFLTHKKESEFAMSFAGPMPNEVAISREQLALQLKAVTGESDGQAKKIKELGEQNAGLTADLAIANREKKEMEAKFKAEIQALRDIIRVSLDEASSQVKETTQNIRALRSRPSIDPTDAQGIIDELKAKLNK